MGVVVFFVCESLVGPLSSSGCVMEDTPKRVHLCIAPRAGWVGTAVPGYHVCAFIYCSGGSLAGWRRAVPREQSTLKVPACVAMIALLLDGGC